MKIRSLVFLGVMALISTADLATAEETIRVGHFPNITHVQALVAHHFSRAESGWFEHRLGRDVKIEWYIYNAGPSAMEAILADSIDLTSRQISEEKPSPRHSLATRRTLPAGHGWPTEG